MLLFDFVEGAVYLAFSAVFMRLANTRMDRVHSKVEELLKKV